MWTSPKGAMKHGRWGWGTLPISVQPFISVPSIANHHDDYDHLSVRVDYLQRGVRDLIAHGAILQIQPSQRGGDSHPRICIEHAIYPAQAFNLFQHREKPEAPRKSTKMSTTLTETPRTTQIETISPSVKDPEQYSYDKLKPYVHPPETKEDLPWAELVTLDLSDLGNPGGKERLAKQLEHAVHHVGFFYVKNFGLSQEEVDKQFTLAKNFFELDVDEKAKYEVDYSAADYNGWRRNGLRKQGQITDNIEIYNFAKFTKEFEGKYDQPDLLKAHLPEIEVFSKALHNNVVLPLLRLFAIVLQLPDEEYLAKQHSYERRSEDHYRYMIYHKRTAGEHEAGGNGLGNGHTDLGSLTLLFRQPVAGLQILGEDGNWTWVSAQPGTITVNLADTLSHLTGGYLKSSVHRVVTPPKDQLDYDRTGLLYFARPHSDTILYPILDSPVLQKAGVQPRFDRPITMGEWVKAKQTLQLNPEISAKRYAESGDGTAEIIGGFRDRKYK